MKQLRRIRFALVHNRRNQLNEDGTALVQVRLTQSGKCRYFSTGVWVEPAFWDGRNKVIRETHQLEHQYNGRITEELAKLKAFELLMLQRYGSCPLALFDNYGKEADGAPPVTFTHFALEEIGRPELAPGTRKKHRHSIGLLVAFQKEVHFDEISPAFVARYDRFLHRRGLALNTVDSHHRVLKAYINRAILFDHLPADANPYRKFKSRTEEPDRVYLDPGELQRLEELVIPTGKSHLEKARQVFLLSCYTGLRYGDITSLARRHLVQTVKGVEVQIRTEKNGKLLTLPLWLLFRRGRIEWSKPEEIIFKVLKEQPAYYKRAGLEGLPLFRITNQYLNRCLKELAAMARIPKRLTHHCARRTFATYMATRVKTPILQRLLNHSRIDITMIYVRLSNAVVEEELERIDWSNDEREKDRDKVHT